MSEIKLQLSPAASKPSSNTGSDKPNIVPTGRQLWEDAPPVGQFMRNCVLMMIHGDTGTGRSTLALTAPGPIAFLHDNEKLDGIIQLAGAKKKLKLHNFAYALPSDPKEAMRVAGPIWADFRRAYEEAYSWARTIIVDTTSSAYELQRYAHFGGYKPESGRQDSNWGPVNAEWARLFHQMPKGQNKVNVILIEKSKEERKPDGKGWDKPTGKLLPGGNKKIPYWIEVGVITSKSSKPVVVNGQISLSQTQRVFQCEIEKGWHQGGMEGTPLTGDFNTFPGIMSLVSGRPRSFWE